VKQEPVNVPKNFESRVQDLIYNVDEGIGSQLAKGGLYLFAVIALMSVYWLSQFWGLKEPEAMDQAQIARNLMEGEGFTTKVIRPAATWHLEQHGVDPRAIMLQQPDIMHPPVYPWLLAQAFRFVEGSFDPGQKVRAYPPEQWAIIPLGNLFTILTGLLVFLIARRFFEPRIALLGASLFFLTDRVWANSISGTSLPLATLLATLAIYLALILAEKLVNEEPVTRWILPLMFTSIVCALAFLTRYAAGWILAVIVVAISFMAPRRGWQVGLILVALTAVFVSPWIIRNLQVVGMPFGMTTQLVHNQQDEALAYSYERAVAPKPTPGALQIKWKANAATFYESALPAAGTGIMAALFVATFFFRFTRDNVHILRFGLLAGITGLFLSACFFGESSMRAMSIFWPLMILYGLSFFFILLDRLQIMIPIVRGAVIAALVIVSSLPLVLTLMPPRPGYPYPPYFPSYIGLVTNMMQEDELLGTDMPWATAWYGDCSSLLVPATLEEFYQVNDIQKRISGLYFTTMTRDLPYVSGIVTGPYRSWYPIFREMIPLDFPLTEAFFISGRDQLFLTDRARWPQQQR
jgi:4-amino-4-deoxy-L-arabinose transferase-like glycosyltransferase